MCQIQINVDQVKQNAFAEKVFGIVNDGTLALMISIGHRTRLFDVMAEMEPSTAETIAEKAGLQTRYVQEWLNAMTVGKLIELHQPGSLYHLPAEHASSLIRKAGSDNVAIFSQYVSVLGSVEDRIVDCFQHGGGVAYDEFNRFHEVMAEDSGMAVLPSLDAKIIPSIEGLEEQLQNGIKLLDVGCGRGKIIIHLAQKYPNSDFTGFDLCEEPIFEAMAEVTEKGLTNVKFERIDLTNYHHQEQYDMITAFDAIHDQARPDLVLKNINQALKPEGLFFMVDIDGSSDVQNNLDHPMGSLLYSLSCMHCMTVSLAQNGMGLGAMWGREKAREMLKEAGFNDIHIMRLEEDFQNCYYVIRK